LNDNSYHVVYAEGVDATAVLDGFVVSAGQANSNLPEKEEWRKGGGMYNVRSSPTVRNCVFSGNRAIAHGAGMYNDASSPMVTNCTFSKNSGLGEGGGMCNVGSSPTVVNSAFSKNQSLYGGGMYNSASSPVVLNTSFFENISWYRGGGMSNHDSSPTVTNCTFSGNRAAHIVNTIETYGAGMNNERSHPTVSDCTFSANSAKFGGGMSNHDASNPTINNCVFSENGAYYGGGIYNHTSSPTVTNSTFSGNGVRDGGGGMSNHGCSSLFVTNCTFSGNTAYAGGGMHNEWSYPTVTNCTFAGNIGYYHGGGISNYYDSKPIVTNSIFWGEFLGEAGTTEQIGMAHGGTAAITYSIVDVNVITGASNTSADPKLGPLADNGGPTKTHALLAGSSALGSGTTAGAPSRDQRGVARPQGTGVDRGAVEMEGMPEPTPTPTPTPTPIPVIIPPGITLPDGSVVTTPRPLVVTLPPNATPDQKREALRDVLLDGGIPQERVESLLDILEVGDDGRVYITLEGIERLQGLLEGLDIPEGAEGTPLAAFMAMLGQGGNSLSADEATAVVFFEIPESFRGKTAGNLHAIKALTSESAEAFVQVFSLEELFDRCSAVVEVERLPGGNTLKRVLGSGDLITADCLLALAIKDGGSFDLDGAVNGVVVDPVFLVEGGRRSDPDDPHGPHGGSGCAAGGSFSPLLLVLLAPLALLAYRRRR